MIKIGIGDNMTDVTLTYDFAQLFFLFDFILIIVFVSIGEFTNKKQYFKRGINFLVGSSLLIFTSVNVFFTQSGYYWFSIIIGFAGGIYFFRGCLNLAEAKRNNQPQVIQ